MYNVYNVQEIVAVQNLNLNLLKLLLKNINLTFNFNYKKPNIIYHISCNEKFGY